MKSASPTMPERIVINTGPLIALAKARAVDAIGRLPFEFLCPSTVREELDAGAARGFPDVRPDWLIVAPMRGVHAVAAAVLDDAEAAVIQLAVDEGISTVCIDERAGRRIAKAAGLRVTGSLGLLLRAKMAGHLPALRPLLDELRAAGVWYQADLVQRVLAAAGED